LGTLPAAPAVAGGLPFRPGGVVVGLFVCVRVTVFVDVDVVGGALEPPPPRPARTSSTTIVAASRNAAGAA
jgi:hypothetical protein